MVRRRHQPQGGSVRAARHGHGADHLVPAAADRVARGGVERARRIATFPLAGQRQVVSFLETHSTLGAQFAGRIGLGDAVCLAIGQAYKQWDGKGHPRHLRGEEICLPARLVQLAGPVEVFSRRQGVEAARRIVRKHRGTLFDPAVADLFSEHAWQLLDGLDEAATWDAVLDAEPSLARRVEGPDLDDVLQAMADLVDLKSPYLAGHSRGWRTSPARRRACRASPVTRWSRCDARAFSTTLAGSGCPTRSGTGRARSRRPRSSASACTRT